MSFARKSGFFTVLELGPQAAAVFRLKAAGAGVHIAAQQILNGPWAEDSARTAALKEAAAAAGATGDPAFIVLPRHEVTSRIMEFPSQDEAELSGMVRFAAGDLVPYPVEELVTAHCVLQRLADGSSRVLVAVVHNDTLNASMAAARAAGFKPESVLWSTACLATALKSLDPANEELRAILDLGASGFEILVARGSTIEYTRGIATDAPWATAPTPENNVELAAELRTALGAHRRESLDGASVSEIYLSSDLVDVEPFKDALAKEVDYIVEATKFDRPNTAEDTPDLSGVPLVALGAALTVQGAAACPIDLTPRKELQQRARASVKTKAIRCAIAAAVLLTALVAPYWQAIHQRNERIGKLERQVEALRPHVRDAVNKRRHLERLQREVERKDTALELFSVISDIMPRKGMNYTNFRYRRDDGIQLFGRAETLKQIQDMTAALRAVGESSIPLLARASIGYQRLAKERDQEVYDYSIPIPFAPEEEVAE